MRTLKDILEESIRIDELNKVSRSNKGNYIKTFDELEPGDDFFYYTVPNSSIKYLRRNAYEESAGKVVKVDDYEIEYETDNSTDRLSFYVGKYTKVFGRFDGEFIMFDNLYDYAIYSTYKITSPIDFCIEKRKRI